LALDQNATVLDLLPKWCASSPVFCIDIGLFPGWIPLHGDPRFQALVKKYDTISKPPAPASSP
ncbi:MAG TPA: hypothetical protein VFK08_01215, partial [Rhodanobacteraceae bacterium]|nr:hypothetical protein [Rhodanobacteraceae bacterium]